jgi:hypothetical protein
MNQNSAKKNKKNKKQKKTNQLLKPHKVTWVTEVLSFTLGKVTRGSRVKCFVFKSKCLEDYKKVSSIERFVCDYVASLLNTRLTKQPPDVLVVTNQGWERGQELTVVHRVVRSVEVWAGPTHTQFSFPAVLPLWKSDPESLLVVFFKNNFGLAYFYWKNTFYTAKHIFPKFFSISFAI